MMPTAAMSRKNRRMNGLKVAPKVNFLMKSGLRVALKGNYLLMVCLMAGSRVISLSKVYLMAASRGTSLLKVYLMAASRVYCHLTDELKPNPRLKICCYYNYR